MATRAVASAVFPHPIEKVWKELRDFTFPGKYFATIQEATMDDNVPPTTVGAVRTLIWKTGEKRYVSRDLWYCATNCGETQTLYRPMLQDHLTVRKHRLIEVSDQHFRVVWELVEADPPTEISAQTSTLSLYRITEAHHTLVQWESDFSSDVKPEIINFETKSYLENLKEVRAGLK